MGILDNFEKGLERAVNGAFAKTFRSGLQPVEIGSALKRELDTTAAIVSRDRILVPNNLLVKLGATDFQRMSALGQTLVDDLVQIVVKHAAAQNFQFAGGVSVELVETPRLTAGMLEIESSTIQREVTWVPVLDVGGMRHPITQERTVIGRGHDADITVEDTGISRKHIEVRWDGQNAEAIDLGSTNGSQLNGQPFKRAVMNPDSVIQIGRTRIVFRVIAQSSPAASPSGEGHAVAGQQQPGPQRQQGPPQPPAQTRYDAPSRTAGAPDARPAPPGEPEPFRWNL